MVSLSQLSQYIFLLFEDVRSRKGSVLASYVRDGRVRTSEILHSERAPVWLNQSTCRVRTPEGWTMFTWKAASGGQLMSQCIQDRCPLKLILLAVTVLSKVISSELFHNTYMTTFTSNPFNEQGQMSQENIEKASLDYQGSILLGFP